MSLCEVQPQINFIENDLTGLTTTGIGILPLSQMNPQFGCNSRVYRTSTLMAFYTTVDSTFSNYVLGYYNPTSNTTSSVAFYNKTFQIPTGYTAF